MTINSKPVPLDLTIEAVLLAGIRNKDTASRLKRFSEYMALNGRVWWKPDLVGYGGYLRRQGLSESSIKAHLSSVRSRYRALLRQRDIFYGLISRQTSMVEAKLAVDELVTRIENAIHPDEAPLTLVTKQDITDRDKTWLSRDEAEALIYRPDAVNGNTPLAWRDSAILALLVSTGVRESELAALDVGDLYQTIDRELCLLVRHGKGNKQRAIPYGDFMIGLDRAERWIACLSQQLEVTETTPLFWSFWKDGRALRGRLSARRIGEVVRSYGVIRDGREITVSPHDLRRTYARLQSMAGLGLINLQHNMGHTSLEMTKRYIGDAGIRSRRNVALF